MSFAMHAYNSSLTFSLLEFTCIRRNRHFDAIYLKDIEICWFRVPDETSMNLPTVLIPFFTILSDLLLKSVESFTYI